MYIVAYPTIEKKVEIDTVAAGSHTETKREIDYTQVNGAVDGTTHPSPSHIDLNPRLSHIGHGTNCTAQPTVENVLLHERVKGEEVIRRPIETTEL